MLSTDQLIMVPWDYSEMSRDALDRALEIAKSPEQIEVIHVTPYPDAMEPSVVWGTYNEDEIAERLERSFFDEIDQEKFSGIKFTAMFGDPGNEISTLAKERNAGLIVISSHGRRGISRFLMGSVAERVVRLAPCPVLVLRDKPDSE